MKLLLSHWFFKENIIQPMYFEDVRLFPTSSTKIFIFYPIYEKIKLIIFGNLPQESLYIIKTA